MRLPCCCAGSDDHALGGTRGGWRSAQGGVRPMCLVLTLGEQLAGPQMFLGFGEKEESRAGGCRVGLAPAAGGGGAGEEGEVTQTHTFASTVTPKPAATQSHREKLCPSSAPPLPQRRPR